MALDCRQDVIAAIILIGRAKIQVKTQIPYHPIAHSNGLVACLVSCSPNLCVMNWCKLNRKLISHWTWPPESQQNRHWSYPGMKKDPNPGASIENIGNPCRKWLLHPSSAQLHWSCSSHCMSPLLHHLSRFIPISFLKGSGNGYIWIYKMMPEGVSKWRCSEVCMTNQAEKNRSEKNQPIIGKPLVSSLWGS